MYCKIVVTDACSKWHSVEDIHEQIVNFNIILLKHLLPKSIEFSDHSRLMISSQHHYTFWIIQFETEDEQADFDPIFASIHVIAHKTVVEVVWLTNLRQNGEKIDELTVYVTNDATWLLYLN